MTDVPIRPPALDLERWTAALGNLARPFVLYSASFSATVATITIPFTAKGLTEGALYIGAAWGGVAALYGAKALEERGKAKSQAEVAIAQTATVSPEQR